MWSFFERSSLSDRVLTKGASVAFLAQIAAVGLGYAAHVFLARVMGVTEYGVYVYVLGWAVPLAALGGLGIHLIVLRFVPTYIAGARFGLVRGSYRAGARYAFGAGILVTLLSLVVLFLTKDAMSQSLWWSLVIGVTLVPFLSLTHLNASFLKALKRVGWASLSDIVRAPILVVGALILLASSRVVDARTLLIVLAVGLSLIAALQFVIVRKLRPREVNKAPFETEFPRWKEAVGAMLLIEVFQALMIKADILLLGVMVDVETVAVFGVAARIAGLVGFVVAAVGTMAGPMFTELHAKGSQEELKRLVKTASSWMLWPSLLVVVTLALFSSFALTLFGPEFARGATALQILLAAQLVHAVAGPVFVLVTFTGFHTQSARIYGYMLLLNLLLNGVGIHFFGIEGAALAALLTALTWSVMLHRVVSQKLKVTASPLARFIQKDQ